MGVIQRQGAKSAVVKFVGVGIGAISTIFIYSAHQDIYGYAQWLYNISMVFLPFATLGVHAVLVKYYPTFKTPKLKDNGFLLFIISVFCFTFLIFLILIYFFGFSFISFLEWTKIDVRGIIEENLKYIIPLTFLNALNMILINQASNVQRIVIPDLLNNVAYKIWLPILVLLFAAGYLTEIGVVYFIILFFGLNAIFLTLYLIFLDGIKWKFPKWNFLEKGQAKEMFSFGVYSSLNILGTILAFRVDVIMIGTMIGMTEAGLYSIMLFFANVIEVPTKSIIKISSPIISTAWKKNDLEEINTLYTKSSLNLLLIGMPIFLLIWYSLADLDVISNNHSGFYENRYIFLLLGLAKLIEMAFGLSAQIISYSKFYRYNLYFLIILGVSNLVLNYYLISKFGVLGAAMATAFSIIMFNIIKYFFLFGVYRFQPFRYTTIKLIAIGLFAFFIIWWIPAILPAPLNAIFAGMLILLIYGGLVLRLNISSDAKETLNYILQLIRLTKR